MKRWWSLILTFVGAFLIVFALRTVVFSVLEIPHSGYSPLLQKGDRVLVQRWSYGYRLFWKGEYHRLCPKPIVCGDWVAFNLPDNGGTCIGRIFACPEDTVWMGANGLVSEFQNFSKGCIWPVVLPAKDKKIRATKWDKGLYDQTLRHYEQPSAYHAGDSTYCFCHNYYWISSGSDENLSDSRTMGFLPEEYILGKVSTVLYAVDTCQKWPCLRKDRIFLPVGK